MMLMSHQQLGDIFFLFGIVLQRKASHDVDGKLEPNNSCNVKSFQNFGIGNVGNSIEFMNI